MPALKHLDVSYNSLAGVDLAVIIDALCHESASKIRTLNVSGNIVTHVEAKLPGHANGLTDKFSEKCQKLLKSSLTLQHFDISHMGLDDS